MPIKLRIQNVAWRWTKGKAGQNQMTEASDGGTSVLCDAHANYNKRHD